MAKVKKPTTVLFLRNIPVDVKAQYKAFCAKRGRSMIEDIIKYMEDCIQRSLGNYPNRDENLQ